MFIHLQDWKKAYFYSKANVKYVGAALDLYSMNYFSLRFTPTAAERLCRARA